MHHIGAWLFLDSKNVAHNANHPRWADHLHEGKLVSAATHVLVNASTRGHGSFIENMVEAEE